MTKECLVNKQLSKKSYQVTTEKHFPEKPVNNGFPSVRPKSKLAIILNLLLRPQGASILDMMSATGWGERAVRGSLSYPLGKCRGYCIVSQKQANGVRVYKIDHEQSQISRTNDKKKASIKTS